MLEQGKKRAVIAAFDWPGWDRGARSEAAALEVHESYRPRYARVAELAGLGAEFAAAGPVEIVERVPGIGMTDFYNLSGRTATAEQEPMSEAQCERKVALLQACWAYFDSVAASVSPELRKGPRGGGRDRDRIVRHANGAEILEHALKVGVKTPDDVWQNPQPEKLRGHREAFVAAIRDHNARGAPARTWTPQFLIRRCCYHFLDHAWEMEDRDLTGA